MEEAKPKPKKRRLWYRKKAIAILAKWASEGTRIDFIEQSSGLRHPGTVRTLGADGFLFISPSGANAMIFPLLWQSVTAERGIGTDSEFSSIHIEEPARTYSLVLGHKYSDNALKEAEKLLASWCELKVQELYMSTGDFPVWSFLGSVEKVSDRTYICRQKDSGLSLTFSLDDKICSVEKIGSNAALHIIDLHRNSIFISETALSATDLFRRFSSASQAVN